MFSRAFSTFGYHMVNWNWLNLLLNIIELYNLIHVQIGKSYVIINYIVYLYMFTLNIIIVHNMLGIGLLIFLFRFCKTSRLFYKKLVLFYETLNSMDNEHFTSITFSVQFYLISLSYI